MKARPIIRLVLLAMLAIPACYYDNEEELYPQGECNTTNISFAQDIVPIIQQQCYVCHSSAANQGNITLEGHANFVTYAQNGRLLGAINHQSGFVPMPQNAPKLNACNIAKIEAWVAAGALNN